MNKDTYSSGTPDSWRDKLEYLARTKIYNALNSAFPINNLTSIIDVGVTTDRCKQSSNFFEKTYPKPERITAFSNQNASWLEKEYEGLKFV